MIFISHSTADDEFVNQLHEGLLRLGYHTFVDHHHIYAGRHWDEVVEEQLTNSEALILVLSPEARDSENVEAEWRTFYKKVRDEAHPLIPVIVRNCRIPMLLDLMNHIDFSNGASFDYQFEKLLKALPPPPARKHTVTLTKEYAETAIERMKTELERVQLERNVMIGYNQLLVSLMDFGKVQIYDLDKEKLFIGWVHSINDARPEIDLTKYKAHESGVSRQHAMISRTGGILMLEDIGSLNGTQVDGVRLGMYERTPLKNGSQVVLGSLRMLIFFKLSS
ncbi:MAG: hypothetical protein OHK0046_28960 [Anaerolineae bacterium]